MIRSHVSKCLSPRQLRREVDDSLHQLPPRYERLLRYRFRLGNARSVRMVKLEHPALMQRAALRALRQLGTRTRPL
jgi:hypothetical protein